MRIFQIVLELGKEMCELRTARSISERKLHVNERFQLSTLHLQANKGLVKSTDSVNANPRFILLTTKVPTE